MRARRWWSKVGAMRAGQRAVLDRSARLWGRRATVPAAGRAAALSPCRPSSGSAPARRRRATAPRPAPPRRRDGRRRTEGKRSQGTPGLRRGASERRAGGDWTISPVAGKGGSRPFRPGVSRNGARQAASAALRRGWATAIPCCSAKAIKPAEAALLLGRMIGENVGELMVEERIAETLDDAAR